MAGMHFPSSGLPKPSSSDNASAHRSGSSTAPKLRDSCHACSSSKVKCHKEKPACSRCTKRGLTCEYVATKRVGRKYDNRSSTSDSSNTPPNGRVTLHESQLPPQSNWFTPNPTIARADYQPTPNGIHAPTRPTSSSTSSNLFSTLLSPVDQSLSSAPLNLGTDLDDFFASPISFSVPDAPDTDVLAQTDFSSTALESSSNGIVALHDTFGGLENALPELPTFFNPRSPPNSRESPASVLLGHQDFYAIDSPCCCLTQALSLMKQLFPNPSASCTTSTTQSLNKVTSLPTIQSVITKNEQTIKAVSTMLECSCSRDGYLLAIISLIVFKVLGWYAAAARKKPVTINADDYNFINSKGSPSVHDSQHSEQVQMTQGPVVVGNYCLDGEDSARMAAQLVLSELHRVQRLVNQLTTKLEGQTAKKADHPDASTLSNTANHEKNNGQTMKPFSAVMLNQLAVDLKKRLRALSLEIVESLRRD